MKNAWDSLLGILPVWMRSDVDKHGRNDLQELRLRIGQLPVLVCTHGVVHLGKILQSEDLAYIVNTATQYSPWSAATSANGYITAPGGHRIGICGDAVVQNGRMQGIRSVESLCLRVARDFIGIAGKIRNLEGNILIIGPPGSGKTTFLRDLIRQKSNMGCVCVVDERGELFPAGFYRGEQTDVLIGPPKEDGMECLIRTMNPIWIAVDEITSDCDCKGLIKCCWCGINIMATAHAGSLLELKNREVYKPLIENRIFQSVIVLRRDKSWNVERINA